MGPRQSSASVWRPAYPLLFFSRRRKPRAIVRHLFAVRRRHLRGNDYSGLRWRRSESRRCADEARHRRRLHFRRRQRCQRRIRVSLLFSYGECVGLFFVYYDFLIFAHLSEPQACVSIDRRFNRNIFGCKRQWSRLLWHRIHTEYGRQDIARTGSKAFILLVYFALIFTDSFEKRSNCWRRLCIAG